MRGRDGTDQRSTHRRSRPSDARRAARAPRRLHRLRRGGSRDAVAVGRPRRLRDAETPSAALRGRFDRMLEGEIAAARPDPLPRAASIAGPRAILTFARAAPRDARPRAVRLPWRARPGARGGARDRARRRRLHRVEQRLEAQRARTWPSSATRSAPCARRWRSRCSPSLGLRAARTASPTGASSRARIAASPTLCSRRCSRTPTSTCGSPRSTRCARCRPVPRRARACSQSIPAQDSPLVQISAIDVLLESDAASPATRDDLADWRRTPTSTRWCAATCAIDLERSPR